MRQQTVATLLAVTLIGTALYGFSPSVRTSVDYQIHRVAGWSEAARQADPVGFIDHVESELKSDLAQLEETRKALLAEVSIVSREHCEQQALLESTRHMSGEFRAAWQKGDFPVTVRNAAYTEDDLRSQVSTLLAQMDGYRANVSRLADVKAEAERRLEQITVQTGKTRAELAALGTQREMLRSRELTAEGREMLTHVDDLLHGNRTVVEHNNPVRSVRELMDAKPAPEARTNADRVTQFLKDGQPNAAVETAGTD